VSKSILFGVSTELHIAIASDVNVDHDGSTTHGTIFNVFLIGSFRGIDGDDDFFAAVVTDVAGFGLHFATSF